MKRTLFISDLHLSAAQPDITAAFFEFLDTHIDADVDALYILGDFFEVWVGDDANEALSDDIATRLKAISDSGVKVYFIHGNRDFLIGKKYAAQAGMTLLPEQSVINLYGTQVVLLHGDEMCTQDIEYQKFRRKSRGWWWPRLMLAMPLWYRRRVARNARIKSKMSQKNKRAEILDVEPGAVLETFAAHKVELMIHGHTHRPAIHDHGGKTRVVLGDWYEHSSYIVADASGLTLCHGHERERLYFK
ncbi:UDP-2,3-diacylglucosamine diphosphatase [Pseudoalteromonas sp. T1lg76]|uniref:UDP-2,3-diacylglucosamine diphosphatase n=1 Tax=Pseudoalteromonas sp. T1lg76 TaxID=2077103 RepID=UPI000CF5FB6D|nr:UDP-2,3-diacylglucosamine diphosphatase [Pseudoalteromonas sp. T1lg76]